MCRVAGNTAKRALNIIYTGTHGMPYANSLFLAGLATLAERREKLSHKFFNSVEEPRCCLHHLLPPPRDPVLLTRLRTPSKFPRIPNRTKKYQSFISHALSKYQTSEISVACRVYISLPCFIFHCVLCFYCVFILLFSFSGYYSIDICCYTV